MLGLHSLRVMIISEFPTVARTNNQTLIRSPGGVFVHRLPASFLSNAKGFVEAVRWGPSLCRGREVPAVLGEGMTPKVPLGIWLVICQSPFPIVWYIMFSVLPVELVAALQQHYPLAGCRFRRLHPPAAHSASNRSLFWRHRLVRGEARPLWD